jgi:hypothetical protein
MQSPNHSTLQPPKARWKATSPTGKTWLSFSHTDLFKQQVEYGIVHRSLQSSNTNATPVQGQVQTLLKDEQMFSLESLLTVFTTSFRPSKSWKREGYMTSYMHVFNTNKVP